MIKQWYARDWCVDGVQFFRLSASPFEKPEREDCHYWIADGFDVVLTDEQRRLFGLPLIKPGQQIQIVSRLGLSVRGWGVCESEGEFRMNTLMTILVAVALILIAAFVYKLGYVLGKEDAKRIRDDARKVINCFGAYDRYIQYPHFLTDETVARCRQQDLYLAIREAYEKWKKNKGSL